MKLRIHLVSLSLLLAWQTARAQTADNFFNGGAQLYISNNIPAALEVVTNGRAAFPNDVKLKKLEELLKHQQQQQQQQNQQNQQNQSQQQQQKDQQKQQQQSPDSQQNQQQQNQQQQNSNSQQNQAQQNQQSQQNQNQEQEAAARRGKEMTPEEAKKLLDAQKDNEQVLQLRPQGKPDNPTRIIKDW